MLLTLTTTPTLLPRLAARAVDAAVLAATGMAVGAAIGFGWSWFAFQLVLVAAYVIGFDVARGATPGKALLGLRVVGPDGRSRPTVAEAARREAVALLGAVPFVGPVTAAVGFVAVVWSIRTSPTGQGVHDRLAGGTAVVRAVSP